MVFLLEFAHRFCFLICSFPNIFVNDLNCQEVLIGKSVIPKYIATIQYLILIWSLEPHNACGFSLKAHPSDSQLQGLLQIF